MNKVVLSGRLTRDPEIKYCGQDNSTCVARFTLAVNRNNKDNEADFISIKVIGKRAEWVEKYIHQGSRIELDGSIQTGSYDNERGDKVYYTEVLANGVEFGESKKAQTEAQQASAGTEADKAAEPNKVAEQTTTNWDFQRILEGAEELPFS